MRGLLPHSLPSPIPYNPDLSSGSLYSSFCGGLRRLSSVPKFKKMAKSGCWGGLCAGGCVPLGAGVCGPICNRASSTASPGKSSLLHPSTHPIWEGEHSNQVHCAALARFNVGNGSLAGSYGPFIAFLNYLSEKV